VSGQLHVPTALSTVPTAQEAGWAQSRSGRGGKEKNSQPLPGQKPPDNPSRNPPLNHRPIPALSYLFICFIHLSIYVLISHSSTNWIPYFCESTRELCLSPATAALLVTGFETCQEEPSDNNITHK